MSNRHLLMLILAGVVMTILLIFDSGTVDLDSDDILFITAFTAGVALAYAVLRGEDK